MKNKENWKPSKYVKKNGKLRASRNVNEVGAGSRLITDIIASFYEFYIPKYAKGKLIDLGCGKAPLHEMYNEYIKDSVCVDWENTVHKNEFLDLECDLSHELPFNDNEFDTIILSDVLEHVPEPDKLWREISRLLSTGGIAFINVPFFYCLHEIPHDYYRYTEYALRRFATNNDLSVLVLKPTGGTPEILTDIIAKHSQFIPLIGKYFAIAIQFLASVFVGSRVGGKLSEKTAEAFPLGYFMIVEKKT